MENVENNYDLNKYINAKQEWMSHRMAELIVPARIFISLGFILSGFALGLIKAKSNLANDKNLLIIYILIGLVFSGIIYCIGFLNIFFLEKLVWVKSYYQKQHITAEESRKLAKKLFYQYLNLRLYIFLIYYLPFILIFLSVWYILFYLSANYFTYIFRSHEWLSYIYFACIATSIVLPWYYLTNLRKRLAFVWFVFIDNVGEKDYSLSRVIEKVRRLNRVDEKIIKTKAKEENITDEIVVEKVGGALISLGSTNGWEYGFSRGSAGRAIATEPDRQKKNYENMVVLYRLYLLVKALDDTK